jgi:hypothetical protein
MAHQPVRLPDTTACAVPNQVLLCCRAALVAMGRERGELAARVVDLLVALLLAGHVAGVCDTLHGWAKQGAEPSLMRSFIVKVCTDAVGGL